MTGDSAQAARGDIGAESTLKHWASCQCGCWICCRCMPADPTCQSVHVDATRSGTLPPHRIADCPMLSQPLSLAQLLQDCTRQLVSIMAQQSNGGGELMPAFAEVIQQCMELAPRGGILNTGIIRRLALRKSFLECLLHRVDGQLAFLGTSVTGFQADPNRLQQLLVVDRNGCDIAIRPLNNHAHELRNSFPRHKDVGAIHLTSPSNGWSVRTPQQLHQQQTIFMNSHEPKVHSTLVCQSNPVYGGDTVARSQNDAVLMSLLSPTQGSTVASPNMNADDCMTVANRTRAKLPLKETSIDDLEKLLVDMDDMNNNDDRYSDVDYRNFVQSLANDGVATELETDRDEDDDELIVNDQDSIREPEEEYRNDAEVEVSQEELKDLLEGVDEEDEQSCSEESVAMSSRCATPASNELNWQAIELRVRRQLNVNFQLCLQGYTISREKDGVAAESTRFWLTQMLELNSLYSPGTSRFGIVIDGIHLLGQLLPALENVPMNSEFREAMNAENYIRPGKRQSISLPPSVQMAIKTFEQYFDEQYLPNIIPAFRRNFTEIEDSLLLRGLRSFGNGGWALISKFMLPGKTAKQIHNRYKNRVTRRADANPIKDFDFIFKKPMSVKEQRLLERGVALYGTNFYRISTRLIPGRPPGLLAKAWNLMKGQKADGIASLSLTSGVPPLITTPTNENQHISNSGSKRRHSISFMAEKADLSKRSRLLLIPEEDTYPRDDSNNFELFPFGDCPTPEFFTTF